MHKALRHCGVALVLLSIIGMAATGIRWNGVTEVATGRGEKGPWRQNDSRYDYVDDATVAADANGSLSVAWVNQKSKDVFHQRFSAQGVRQGEAVNVSRNPATFSWAPRIATDPRDPKKVYLLWQEIIFSGGSHGGDILFARSTDGGTSFSTPLNLSNSRAGDGKGRINREVWSNGSLDLAVGANGVIHAAWTEYEGKLWLARSKDGGNSFERPQLVAGDGRLPARAPALATGPGQTVYLAWTVGEDAAADIRVAQSVDGGATFGAPNLVGSGAGYSDAPRIAVSPGGALHLVYAAGDDGPFGRYHVRHTRSSGGAARFGAPRVISAAGSRANEGAAYPALAAQGALVVLWEVFPDRGAGPRGLALTFSADDGRSFAAPMAVPGSADPAGGANGSHQGLLGKKLAVDSAGRIAIVNSSLKTDERSRVWLIRGQIAR